MKTYQIDYKQYNENGGEWQKDTINARNELHALRLLAIQLMEDGIEGSWLIKRGEAFDDDYGFVFKSICEVREEKRMVEQTFYVEVK